MRLQRRHPTKGKVGAQMHETHKAERPKKQTTIYCETCLYEISLRLADAKELEVGGRFGDDRREVGKRARRRELREVSKVW